DGFATQRGLARALDVSPTAVRKAEREGRISGPNADGHYNVEKARREWANNTVGNSPPKLELNEFREIPIDPITGEPDWLQYPVGRRSTEQINWLKAKVLRQRLAVSARLLIPRA